MSNYKVTRSQLSHSTPIIIGGRTKPKVSADLVPSLKIREGEGEL